MDSFLIIDGNSILNRAFYGIRMLNSESGVPTNAVYGFLNIFLKQIETVKPTHIAVAFDLPAKTFRHKMFDGYKAKRKKMPDELAVQLPLIKKVLSAMNVKILETEGFEADDIIGTVSRICTEEKAMCRILTGDKDDLQLAGEYTKIDLVVTSGGKTTTKTYGENEVFEDFGVTPREFIDLKAIMGDSSDNIPGAAGIGAVGARSLISAFHSIDGVYENIESDKIKASLKEKLIKEKEMVYLSLELSKIITDVPLLYSFNECKVMPYNADELSEILSELSLKSLEKRLLGEEKLAEIALPEFITKDELFYKMPDGKKASYFVYEDEDGICAAISSDGETAFFAEDAEALDVLRLVFGDAGLEKIGNNVKDDIVKLKKHNIDFCGTLFDTAIAAYVLNPARSSYETAVLSEVYMGQAFPDFTPPKKEALPKSSKKALCALSAVLSFKLKDVLYKEIIDKNEESLLKEIELPLVLVLAEMEIAGFKVDADALLDFSKLLDGRIGCLTEKIYACAGEEFNINSPRQLSEILFEKLHLPAPKKKKSGYSTDIKVLGKLSDKHEIIPLIMEYRSLSKLKSTYADGLFAAIDKSTYKVHSNFKQTVTQTGRLSSTEPNLQNIPARTELGLEIRKMFIPEKKGSKIVSADYSQIELRVLASMAKDEAMISAFKSGDDIHAITASQVFSVPLSEVTPLLRTRAKAVNFGILYGMGDFSLSQDLKITKAEAKSYIESYKSHYPAIAAFQEKTIEEAKKTGYVTTLFGRRRYLPELLSDNFITRSLGERMALNTPIQGTAADIIKIAMVRVAERLKKENLKSKLILQVHDELIVEAEENEVSAVVEILKYEMEHAASLMVPLSCSINYGGSWYEAK